MNVYADFITEQSKLKNQNFSSSLELAEAVQMDAEMKTAVNNYLDAIADSYHEFHSTTMNKSASLDMINAFEKGLQAIPGKKYIKVVTADLGSNKSAHSFIVNTHDDKKFAYGDILRPATFTAPTRNKRRGNVFKFNEPNPPKVSWTSAE